MIIDDGLIQEIKDWGTHNFGGVYECPVDVATLGLAEETGEVCRAVLKQKQGIRGSHEAWQAEIAKELGDVFIKIVDVAWRAGLDPLACIEQRWASIRLRDFRADPVGHGLPTSRRGETT